MQQIIFKYTLNRAVYLDMGSDKVIRFLFGTFHRMFRECGLSFFEF